MGAEYQATFAETTSMALLANNTFADAYNFAVSAAKWNYYENNAIAQTYHGGLRSLVRTTRYLTMRLFDYLTMFLITFTMLGRLVSSCRDQGNGTLTSSHPCSTLGLKFLDIRAK